MTLAIALHSILRIGKERPTCFSCLGDTHMAHGDTSTATSQAPPLAMGLRINLSLMMFLEFAVWGAWYVVFVPYLVKRGFSEAQAGALIGILPWTRLFPPCSPAILPIAFLPANG